MQIEISQQDLSWVLSGFLVSFNHEGGGYKTAGFDLAMQILNDAKLKQQEHQRIEDNLFLIAYPKGKRAKDIQTKRSMRV